MDTVIFQGTAGDEFFMLVQGVAVVTRKNDYSDPTEVRSMERTTVSRTQHTPRRLPTATQVGYEVARIEAPSWFGETAIVTKEKRNASVHAGESGMTLLVMTREDFLAAKRLTHDEMEDKAKALR